VVSWIAGIVLVYSFLFGIGKLLFGETGTSAVLFGIGLASAFVIKKNFDKSGI
jgi:hypothetical protein